MAVPEKVDRLVESYLNGNRAAVAAGLRRMHKIGVLQFAQALQNATRHSPNPENGINTTIRLLQMELPARYK